MVRAREMFGLTTSRAVEEGGGGAVMTRRSGIADVISAVLISQMSKLIDYNDNLIKLACRHVCREQ